jgi:hypothetical protein
MDYFLEGQHHPVETFLRLLRDGKYDGHYRVKADVGNGVVLERIDGNRAAKRRTIRRMSKEKK